MKSRWWCGAPDPQPSRASRASFTIRPTSPPPRTTTPPLLLPADVLRTWAPAKLRRLCLLCLPTTVPRPPAGYWSTALKPVTAAALAWGQCRGGPRGGRPRSWTGNPDTCTTLTPPHWRVPGWRRPMGTTTSYWPPSIQEARYRCKVVVGCIFIISFVLLILTMVIWWHMLDMSPYLISLVWWDRWTVYVQAILGPRHLICVTCLKITIVHIFKHNFRRCNVYFVK